MNIPVTGANVRIIDDLKKFVKEVSEDDRARAEYVESPKDFTRNRLLTLSTTATFILNAPKRSLQVELNGFFDRCVPGEPCSKQAFSERRGKLKPKFFIACNEVFGSSFYRHYGEDAKRWKDMILCAVDGSALELPDTEELARHYGRAGNGGSAELCVMARIFLLHDVLNDICIRGFLHPLEVSEGAALFRCLPDLSLDNHLLLFDRNYPSFWLMYMLKKKRAKFVIRLPRNAGRTVEKFLKSPDDDIIAKWEPSPRSTKKLREAGYSLDITKPLKVRPVKVLLSTGETEILATNLYDGEKYAKEDLKEVYGLRRRIETGYGYFREELQPAQFGGIRKVCVEQDFVANILFYNIRSMIAKQTEFIPKNIARNGKYEYKINKNVSFGSLKDRIVLLFRRDSRSILIELEKLFAKSTVPVIPGRKNPQKKKRARRGKYRTEKNHKRSL